VPGRAQEGHRTLVREQHRAHGEDAEVHRSKSNGPPPWKSSAA